MANPPPSDTEPPSQSNPSQHLSHPPTDPGTDRPTHWAPGPADPAERAAWAKAWIAHFEATTVEAPMEWY